MPSHGFMNIFIDSSDSEQQTASSWTFVKGPTGMDMSVYSYITTLCKKKQCPRLLPGNIMRVRVCGCVCVFMK